MEELTPRERWMQFILTVAVGLVLLAALVAVSGWRPVVREARRVAMEAGIVKPAPQAAPSPQATPTSWASAAPKSSSPA